MMAKRKQKTTDPTTYPSGTFLDTGRGMYYLQGNRRLRIITTRVMESWRPHRIVYTTEEALVNYPVNGRLKFRNGSLLYSQASGRMYLVSDGKLRHITNPDVLERIGAGRYDAVWVSLDEINLHEKGESLK